MNPEGLRKYNVIYCESQPIVDKVKIFGVRAIKAMGTNTDLFKPNPKKEKDIPYFYPATFSPWKRQSKIAYLGDQLLCVGTVQPDGYDELKACEDNNVNIRIGYFPVKKIVNWFQRAKQVWVPAIHGSERTVLEAMSSGIEPVVISENKRAHSYVVEYAHSEFKNPRDFILANYSHTIYTNKLSQGIEQI